MIMRKIVLHIGKACYHMGKALLGLAQRLIAWGSVAVGNHDVNVESAQKSDENTKGDN